MHYSIKLLFCMLSVVITLFIASSCSNSSNQSIKENSSLSEVISQLLEPMHESNTFVFEGIPWLITKEEVIQQKQLIDAQIDAMERIIVVGEQTLDASIKQYVIYNFENDQLVSGEVWLSTSDKEQFEALGLAVKEVLQESFPEPRTANLDVLDADTASEGKNKTIIWQGTDRSYMQINMLINEASEYILQIRTASPVAERNSLR